MAEPPSCPLALDMSLRNSSYSVTPGPLRGGPAALRRHEPGLAGPQSRDHGFLRTKMKVLDPHSVPEAQGHVWVHMGPAQPDGPNEIRQTGLLDLGPDFYRCELPGAYR